MRKAYVSTALLSAIAAKFPNAAYNAEETRPAVYIGADELIAFLTHLRDDDALELTRAENVTGIDWKEHFEMVYHLFSPTKLHWLTVKVTLPREELPVVPSATAVYPGVAFEEREVYDLMGISFEGHPDLRRILHADGFVGHPLRKDFVPPPPPDVPRIVKEGY